MRVSLFLIAVRAGTAIVVSTAAVQFWAIAVHGQTPRLTPSIALPSTATAVAAVVPPHRAKQHPAARKPKSQAGTVAGPAEPPAAQAPPASTPATGGEVSHRRAKPTEQRQSPAKQAKASPGSNPAPGQRTSPPAAVQPVLTRPPVSPQLTPVPPTPPLAGG